VLEALNFALAELWFGCPATLEDKVLVGLGLSVTARAGLEVMSEEA